MGGCWSSARVLYLWIWGALGVPGVGETWTKLAQRPGAGLPSLCRALQSLMVDVAFEVVTRQDDIRSNLILMNIFFDKVLNTLPCQRFPEEAIPASPRDRFFCSSCS